MEGSELASRIGFRIEEYLSTHDERFVWAFAAVQRLKFLPLYFGWTALLGIRSDASLVRWDHDDDREVIHELRDPFLCRMTLVAGAKEYPELRALVPARTAESVTCDSCAGTGQLAGLPGSVICLCGGLGWLIPGEQREPGLG